MTFIDKLREILNSYRQADYFNGHLDEPIPLTEDTAISAIVQASLELVAEDEKVSTKPFPPGSDTHVYYETEQDRENKVRNKLRAQLRTKITEGREWGYLYASSKYYYIQS